MRPPNYDPAAVRPMWEELTKVGIRPLTTAAEVDQALADENRTTLVVVNSVCGCAAGNARPGAMLSLQYSKIPDRLTTVFAGMDHEAVERTRGYLRGIPPSSPSIALFKGKTPVHVLERRHIEQMTAEMIANSLAEAYEEHCSAKGPSIPPEEFKKVVPVQICGSTVPTFSS